MTITLNGETSDFENENTLTVEELIAKLELGPQPVLVELDGEAIYAREFPDKLVSDGAIVEIVRMVAGG